MYHEGPPAVAVNDTGNAQNTSIIKICRTHSLSYTLTHLMSTRLFLSMCLPDSFRELICIVDYFLD